MLCLVVSDSLWPHGLQPTRLFCPWGFSRQEYWSGLPCPPPGDLLNPGIEPRSPALQVDSLTEQPKVVGYSYLLSVLGFSLSPFKAPSWLNFDQSKWPEELQMIGSSFAFAGRQRWKRGSEVAPTVFLIDKDNVVQFEWIEAAPRTRNKTKGVRVWIFLPKQEPLGRFTWNYLRWSMTLEVSPSYLLKQSVNHRLWKKASWSVACSLYGVFSGTSAAPVVLSEEAFCPAGHTWEHLRHFQLSWLRASAPGIYLVGRGQGADQCPALHREARPQRIIWPSVSVVLLLRNSELYHQNHDVD